MKQCIFFQLILILFFACNNSTEDEVLAGMTLHGILPDYPDSVLINISDSFTRKDTMIWAVNGSFTYQTKLDFPKRLDVVGIDSIDRPLLFMQQFFAENSDIELTQFEDKLIVSGSSVHAELTEFNNQSRHLRSDSAGWKAFFQEYLNTHQASYIAAENLMFKLKFEKDLYTSDEASELLQTFNEDIQNSYYGKNIAAFISKKTVPQVGNNLVDVLIEDTKGDSLTLYSALGDQYTFIEIWASWCVPCRKHNPQLIELRRQFPNKEIAFVGVSIDNDKKAWIKSIQIDQLNWEQFRSHGGRFGSFGQQYDINGIPDNILVDPQGKIIRRKMGIEELETWLEENFVSESS